MRTSLLFIAALAVASFFPALEAQTPNRRERYAVVMQAPPLALQNDAHKDSQIRAAQDVLRSAIERQGVRVIGSSRLLVNAVYVYATPDQARELARTPGVRNVEAMRPIRRSLDKAAQLVNAPAAWDLVGGADRAGQGVKIGILDSGIDQTHPALQDTATALPAGFPKCSGKDCDYTNRKVIAARSYVDLLVVGEEPAISRPDDTSPRDRVGHGTAAAMVAAGRMVQGPAAAIRGVASGAFLGNYKIFGSPGVNDYTFDDVVIAALEDAVIDGMDIVSLSFGSPALWGPNDRGAVCDTSNNRPCDLLVDAVENAVKLGLTVVTVAGNDGDLGVRLPTLSSIHSPGTAPSAITVGASTNAHAFYAGIDVEGVDVPLGERRLRALFGDGPKPAQALRAGLRDVSKLEDDGKACSPLTNGSLSGAIALIARGDCAFSVKVNNAQRAGAVGAIVFQPQGTNAVTPMRGLTETGIPAALLGYDSAQALKRLLERAPDRMVALNPALQAEDTDANLIAYFSSQGPSIGESAIKPDLAAVGTNLYVATQKYDPNGDMHDPSGFTSAQGTSFSAPMVAGAAAIAKQRNPSLRPGQLKSLLVNTASDVLDDFDFDDRPVAARWTAGGAGLLHVQNAARSNVTIEPASVSFGVVASVPFPSRTLTFTNLSSSTAALSFEVRRSDPDRNLQVTLAPSVLSIPPNSSRELQVRLTGTPPAKGVYEGEIRVTGGAVPLRIPFLYLVADQTPFNIFPLSGFDFTGAVSERLPGKITFKVVDRYGVAVPNVPVRFGATLGGGDIESPMAATDALGIAEAGVVLGASLGAQEFAAEAGGLTVYFTGRSRLRPVIETNGVVNAASLRTENGLAPGSYISIFGRGLSDVTRQPGTEYLPLSLAGVSVSFDVPGRNLSLPGRLTFVSEGLVNVQAPWELLGHNAAKMKVSLGDLSTAIYDLRLNDYSPAAFEYTEAGTGRLLAAARDGGFALIGSANPARRGSAIQIYCNGLGPVTNTPATGEASPTDLLAQTQQMPEVMIGGRPAQVLFSGLTPQAVGLYQLNVTVPPDVPSGIQPVIITVNGVVAKTVSLPVE